MKRSDFLLFGLVIFVASLAALSVWSLIAVKVASSQIQSATAANPLLSLLTGTK